MQEQFDPAGLAQQIEQHFPDIDVRQALGNPVFIVSAPRSGSTLLFEQLARITGIWTIGGEGHGVFRLFPRLRAENAQLDSGSLDATHADSTTQRLFCACLLNLLRDHRGRNYLSAVGNQPPPPLCFVEKTPRNALNVPFLLKIFPQAQFIFLHRDPRHTVASLIEAWTLGLRTGRFKTFDRLPGWDRPGWCFLLPTGWRELRGKTIADIAAYQWMASNQKIMADIKSLPLRQWTSVSYESLIECPQKVLSSVCEFVSVTSNPSNVVPGELPLSRTTVSPPQPDKWKKYEEQLNPLLPDLQATYADIQAFCSLRSEQGETP